MELQIGWMHIYIILNIYSIYFKNYVLSVININENEILDKPYFDYFDDVNPRNVTTVVDETAILKCRVKNKGNRTISWMRKRDLHILTTNIYTYTSDQRFSILHTEGSNDWDLKIEFAQQKDSGIYECQINTEPKINMAVILKVTAVRANILGPNEIFVKKDSTFSLVCSVNIYASSIKWYHDFKLVDVSSGDVSMEIEKTDAGTTSRLIIIKASLNDSGNYTCISNIVKPASIQVHILNGEHPAAMQTNSAIQDAKLNFIIIFMLYILVKIIK